jgi:hypothetical protein
MKMFHPQIVDWSFLNQWVHWQYLHHIPASFKVVATIHYILWYRQSTQLYPVWRYVDASSLTTNIGTPTATSATATSLMVWDAGIGYRMDSSSQKKPLWKGSPSRFNSSGVRPTRNKSQLPWFALDLYLGGFRLEKLTGLPTTVV